MAPSTCPHSLLPGMGPAKELVWLGLSQTSTVTGLRQRSDGSLTTSHKWDLI